MKAAHTGWRRKFDPIELPDGRTLVTLHDAAQYILKLPKRTVDTEPWQLAMRCLIDAADRDGIRMLARMAFVRALKM